MSGKTRTVVRQSCEDAMRKDGVKYGKRKRITQFGDREREIIISRLRGKLPVRFVDDKKTRPHAVISVGKKKIVLFKGDYTNCFCFLFDADLFPKEEAEGKELLWCGVGFDYVKSVLDSIRENYAPKENPQSTTHEQICAYLDTEEKALQLLSVVPEIAPVAAAGELLIPQLCEKIKTLNESQQKAILAALKYNNGVGIAKTVSMDIKKNGREQTWW